METIFRFTLYNFPIINKKILYVIFILKDYIKDI